MQPGEAALLNVPAGQDRHVVDEEAPETVLYVPAAQLVQVVAPRALQVPAGQIALLLPDIFGQEYPTGQDRHVAIEAAPVVVL